MAVDEGYMNICVKRKLRDRIKRLAEKNDVPMTKVIERAIALLESFDDFIEEYKRRI